VELDDRGIALLESDDLVDAAFDPGASRRTGDFQSIVKTGKTRDDAV